MFPKLLARDLGIALVGILAWRFASPWSAGTGLLSDVSGFAVGVLVGACAYLAHEWGHLLGALASRSAVTPAASLRSPFVFSFDSRRNSRRQFLAMSFAGFAATAAALWVVYSLPSELLAARVARGGTVFLALLALVLEVPLVGYTLLTNRVPPVETFDARRDPREAAV